MSEYSNKSQINKSAAVTGPVSQQRKNGSAFQFVDNRPEAIAQRKMQNVINNSPPVQQLKAYQETADNAITRVVQQKEKLGNEIPQPVQKKINNTGLPDNLKAGVENLSGMSMGDVKVHYNSPKPAQLQAHAYAQGTDIHIASGQEKHLPHEAWHVVQQKQGRVKATMQMKGNVSVNDDSRLEHEADKMGNKAGHHSAAGAPLATSKISDKTIQRQSLPTTITGTTHLVQAQGKSIYNGTQGRLLVHGTPIEVETSDKIRSRLGPNQEAFRHYDAKNAPEYRWVRVISVDGIIEPPGTYVRDDTFAGGAEIGRGSAFTPDIDHRGRMQTDLPERTFEPIDAPEWYERPLGHGKSTSADRKHAKLLAVAFNTPTHTLGHAMMDAAKDSDMGITLATVGQHLTHVTPWIPENVENHGKDRNEGFDKSGEYFRTSPSHPLRIDFENHQKVLNIYHENVTNEPVNAGWAGIAKTVMGVTNMDDHLEEHPLGIKFRVSESPDRFARGPGAVIGHEEMARETAKMRHALMANHNIGSLEQATRDAQRFSAELANLNAEVLEIKRLIAEIEARMPTYKQTKIEIAGKIREAKGDSKELKEDARQNMQDEKDDKAYQKTLNLQLVDISKELIEVRADLDLASTKVTYYKKYFEGPVPGLGEAPLKASRKTDLRPLTSGKPIEHGVRRDNFASRLIANRRQVKLLNLFGDYHVGDISDRGGPEHPNLVLHKGVWDKKEAKLGVKEMQDGWNASGLKTHLQVRGSFGHHRPSVSPLLNGMIRINPGLYPMSLLQIGLGYATAAKGVPTITPEMDTIHREALNVAVHHALAVIAADRPSLSDKIKRIKEFAKHNLMINLLKARTILKAHGPDPRNREAYIPWLEKDFSKTAQALENLNESTHLLLSARVNEESAHGASYEPLMLRPGPFRQFVHREVAREHGFRIFYVASGMQAITTGAMAAVAYRRADGETGKAAGFVSLHPYFEMKGATAAAAGFKDNLPAETIIADLSPLDTFASPEAQSKPAIARGLRDEVLKDRTLVPVLDATAMPLGEARAMIPGEAENFIIVESLTKYAQLGSDKALGGRIIVVGSKEFIDATAKIISPVEKSADMIVSKVWFESMENMRYSH